MRNRGRSVGAWLQLFQAGRQQLTKYVKLIPKPANPVAPATPKVTSLESLLLRSVRSNVAPPPPIAGNAATAGDASTIIMPGRVSRAKRSRTVRIAKYFAVATLLYVGFNLEFAPYTGRLRLLAIPIPMELLISKRLLAQEFPDNFVVTGETTDIINKLVSVLTQTAELEFLRDVRPTGNVTTFPWNVTVVESPIVNAYCAPAGTVVVFSGLIDFCVEAEREKKIDSAAAAMCGVLAHEISHGVLRHGMEILSWMPILLVIMLFAQGFFITLGFGSEEVRFLNSLFEEVIQFFLRLPHSRAVESEADLLGAELLERSGLPTEDYPKVLSLLQAKGSEWFSTHPAPEKRAGAIEKHLGAHSEDPKVAAFDTARLEGFIKEAESAFQEFSNRATRGAPALGRLLD